MRYTRYDLKRSRRKKNKLLITIIVAILVIVFSLIIGSTLSKAFNKGVVKQEPNKQTEVKESPKRKNAKFVVVQGGIYAKKENLDDTMKILSNYGMPFSITDGANTRAFLGIYNELEADKIVKNLTEKKVENSKMIFDINIDNEVDEEIAEIIDAEIQILNKLCDSSVKAIKTEDLKKWTVALKSTDDKNKNYQILNDLKKYISAYPSELPREKVAENYIYIYNVLKKIKIIKFLMI